MDAIRTGQARATHAPLNEEELRLLTEASVAEVVKRCLKEAKTFIDKHPHTHILPQDELNPIQPMKRIFARPTQAHHHP